MNNAVQLLVNGRPYEATNVRTVRVASRLAQPAQCELTLDATPGRWPVDWPVGAELEIRVGGHTETLFTGEVTAVEVVRSADGAATTRVRAYDVLHRMRKRQRLRVLEDSTAVAVAKALTSDLNLTVEADDPGPRLQRVVQHRHTDFDLLVEVAARVGRYPVLHGRTLRLVTLAGAEEPVPLTFGRTLRQATVAANVDRVVTSYTAYGWHAQRAEAITERAGTPRSGRRTQLRPDPKAVGVDGARTLVELPAGTAGDVEALAQAALDASAGRAVTLTGVANGDPRLRAGRPITVQGFADQVDGQYVLCSAVHTIDAAGYLTTVDTEPPAPMAGPGPSLLTLGRVTAVDDPDKLGRVRVALMASDDMDLGWLGVVCPGAGRGKGLVALPDVDDTVLVALPHGSPSAGLVLGSVYGTVAPPDPGVEGNSVRRWSLKTADGQSIVVDDEEHLIRLENKAGSYVELSPDLVRLFASTDLAIDAPGKKITISARAVDFEHSLVGGVI